MSYSFEKAEASDVPLLFEIIKNRVRWMDDRGIQQWNATDYLNVYPISYYEEHQRSGRLYKMTESATEKILGVMVLLDSDPRWPGYDLYVSYFVHNFATVPGIKGVGSLMLEEAEKLSVKNSKKFLRLDCAVDNKFLNEYYNLRAYMTVGTCIDGAYRGILREKRL